MAPFLLLSTTLGGVLPMGLVSGIFAILCYTFMLSQLGLLASVICRTSSRAFLVTCVFWALTEFSPFLFVLFGQMFVTESSVAYQEISQWLFSHTLLTNLEATVLAFEPSEIWTPSMTAHLCVGGVAFLFSWLLFEVCTDRAEKTDAGPVKIVRLQRQASRVWNNAAAWKTWKHVTGGAMPVVYRFVTGFLFCFFLTLPFGISFRIEPISWALLGWGTVWFLINIARLFGSFLNLEVSQKTLPALVMLPQATSATLWSMVLGLLPAIAAAAAPVATGLLGVTFCVLIDSSGSLEFLVQPWFMHFFTWILLTLHLGVYLSIQVRYGGMLLAMALLWLLSPMVCGISLSLLSFGSPQELAQYLVPIVLMMLETATCIGLQKAILERVKALAAGSV